jgi:hypothetical protein
LRDGRRERGQIEESRFYARGPLELASTLKTRPHLGAEGPKSIRESQITQPLELQFRAKLGEELGVELALV